MKITDYIKHSRLPKKVDGLKNVANQIQRHYEENYRFIQSIMGSEDGLPHLEICYTVDRGCEIVSINGMENIVYDRYLGQTFNMLNRLYFNSTQISEPLIYSYKIAAEKLLLRGLIGESDMLALLYNMDKNKTLTYKKDIDLNKRLAFTEFQELFVILHEIAHWQINKDSNFEKVLEMKKEMLVEYYQRDLSATQKEEIIDGYILDVHNSYDGGLTPFEEMSNETKSKFRKKISPLIGDNSLQLSLLNSRNDIIEECICDDIAVRYLFEMLSVNQYPQITPLIAEAVHIGLEHLELITFIDDTVNTQYFERTEKSHQIESSIRKQHLRSFVTSYLKITGVDDGIDQTLLKNANEKYSSKIRDQIMFKLPRKIEELQEQIVEMKNEGIELPRKKLAQII